MTDPILAVPTANGRHYQRPGRGDMVPSITNIIGKKDKSGLKYWAAKECANYAVDNLDKLKILTREEAYQLVRNAPFAKRDDSPSAIGDIVHGWIERHIKGEGPSHEEVAQAPQTARWMWNSFLKFRDFYKPEFTGAEFTVWSDKHGYAGTADLSFRLAGHHVLTDTKTGTNIYPETAMQLAAIANADFILTPDGRELPIPAYDRYAILHVRPRGAKLAPVEKIPEAFEAFLALKKVFDWDVNHSETTIGFAPKIG